MDERIFSLIEQIIDTGGTTAIWAIIIIYGTQVIKVGLWLAGLTVVAHCARRMITEGLKAEKKEGI